MKRLMVFSLLCLSSISYAGLEYKSFENINCENIGVIAEDVMSNWKNGASFKEMMENSTKYEKDFSPLVDAGAYMYALNTEAMKTPVRTFSHSQTYEAEIFGIDSRTTCELKKFNSYSGSYLLKKRKECRESAEYASTIMSSRQENLPLKDILNLNQEEYEQRIFNERYRKSEIEKTYIETTSLIIDAYSMPVGGTEIEKEQAIIDYGADSYLKCMN